MRRQKETKKVRDNADFCEITSFEFMLFNLFSFLTVKVIAILALVSFR